METALRAIAGPRRRRILTLVRDGELSAGEIAGHFDVTRPAVSQDLTLLKEAGLVTERRNGTRRLYRVRPEGLTRAEDVAAFVAAPAVVRATLHEARIFPLVLPVLAFPKLAGDPVERHPPGIPQTVSPSLRREG